MNVMLACDFCSRLIEFGSSVYIDEINRIMICKECYDNLPDDDEPEICDLCNKDHSLCDYCLDK